MKLHNYSNKNKLPNSFGSESNDHQQAQYCTMEHRPRLLCAGAWGVPVSHGGPEGSSPRGHSS